MADERSRTRIRRGRVFRITRCVALYALLGAVTSVLVAQIFANISMNRLGPLDCSYAVARNRAELKVFTFGYQYHRFGSSWRHVHVCRTKNTRTGGLAFALHLDEVEKEVAQDEPDAPEPLWGHPRSVIDEGAMAVLAAAPAASWIENAAGFPCLCVWGWDSTQNGSRGVHSFRHADIRMLFLPHWPGLVVNTIFYGGLIFGLRRGPGAVRSHRRRRRGLCVTCGYDRSATPTAPCPECGSAT